MSRLERDREARSLHISALPEQRRMLHVFVLSGLGLFVELLLIRWLDAEVRPLAYVKNLPLIGSFLGLGIGFALSRSRKSLYPLAIALLCAALGCGAILGALPDSASVAGPAGPESNLGVKVAERGGQLLLFYLEIAAVFALAVLSTIPLGQITSAFMEGVPALRAYTANVAGALTGIAGFFVLAGLSIPPWAGAAMAMLAMLAYVTRESGARLVSAVLAVVTCAGMYAVDHRGEFPVVWTPYNKIEVERLPEVIAPDGEIFRLGWVLRVQNLYYQRLLNLRADAVAGVKDQLEIIKHADFAYNYPYTWTRPARVLVVGAGTGNDVAAALRNGAQHVDAVEIDPRIVRFGKELHPEGPYSDARVVSIVDDARSYLKRTDQRYDLIVFGLLDAHSSLFSSLSSNIRLDNYVYTVEAFKDALARLAPGGVLSVSFYAEQPWLVSRLEGMLREAGGRSPLVVEIFYDAGFLYLTGPGAPADTQGRQEASLGLSDEFLRANPPGPLARDSWPFLYLQGRGIPATVVWGSLGVLLVGAALCFAFFRGQVRFDRHLFFLGAGFLLVETRTIAQLGLVFGSTWRVSALTIGVILTLILAANFVIERKGPFRRTPLYCALAAALLANAFVPARELLGGGAVSAWLLAGFLLLPLFFAGLIFASTIRERDALAPALASNLIGSVLGGLLENLVMIVGFPALSLVALVVYVASFRR